MTIDSYCFTVSEMNTEEEPTDFTPSFPASPHPIHAEERNVLLIYTESALLSIFKQYLKWKEKTTFHSDSFQSSTMS